MGDYIAAVKAKPKDLKQSGVKGMKWGVRRSSSQLRAAAKARSDAPTKPTVKKGPNGGEMVDVLVNKKTGTVHRINPDGSAGKPLEKDFDKKPANNIQDNVESSPARYARLAEQAKSGRASEMTETDLKFFNARTEALSKINKLNETQPGWLRETSVKVLQQSAQRQMQAIADTVTDKYIGDPLKTAIKKEAVETVEQAIASGAAKKLREQAIDAGIKKIVGSQKP